MHIITGVLQYILCVFIVCPLGLLIQGGRRIIAGKVN
jgi:hypothetical protein